MRHHILLAAASITALPAVAQAGAADVAAPYVASSDPDEYSRSLECLTQAVYYEARNQSADGQRAVAQVVLNRVRHPSYPNNVCGVVFQGSERATGCQFTFTCDGSMFYGVEPVAWDRAQRIAQSALSGSVYRPVGLALNYHTTSIRPYWAPSLVRQAVIGDHIFYRRPGSTEDSFVQTPGAELEDTPVAAARTYAPRSSRGLGARVHQVSYEIPVMEIPVVERPVRARGVGGRRTTMASASASRRATSRQSDASISIESGVRVTRGR